MKPSRFLLATFGSFGDLHPYIALALELRARGHHPILATSRAYREKIEKLGLEFLPVRPDMPDDPVAMRELGACIMDEKKGPEYVIRQMIMPYLRQAYDDLKPAVADADVIVGHPLMYTIPLLAEELQKPWASVALAPISYFSGYDPPVLPQMPWLVKLKALGSWVHRGLFRLTTGMVNRWCKPWHVLRAEIGLPPDRRNPALDGQHSPHVSLAVFTSLLAKPQPDWPSNVTTTGYLFYDQDGDKGLSPELERFLNAGSPPIVFTLGTSGVLTPGSFYEESRRTVKQLGVRGVLLIGKTPGGPQMESDDDLLVCDYAPYSQLFPRASVIVHQCGAGTTGQVLRSGRPMLAVPFAHDQHDNGERAARLGVGRILRRKRYTAERAVPHLRRLLDDPRYVERAAEVAKHIRQENGTTRAVDALEALQTGRLSDPS